MLPTQHLRPERGNLASDLIAGLTFAVVNVPQAMGHALLAAVNPVYGIYTLMVAVPVGVLLHRFGFHECVNDQRGRWPLAPGW